MKKILIKISPVLLIVILCLTYSFSQEDTDEDVPDETNTEVIKNETTKKVENSVDKKSLSEDQAEEDSDVKADEVENKAEPVDKDESVHKAVTERQPVKKNYIKKKENAPSYVIDKGLLRISPGDTLFERIPEIKLGNNKKSLKVEEIVRIPETLGETDNSSKDASGVDGFFGVSKEKTEIIAQISIVLLILLVFVLYKVRSKGSTRRV